jgi:hypothetical protein
MSPAMDFTSVKGLEPIPQGEYNVEVAEAKVGESQSGNAKIDVRYKVLDGEYEGRIVFETLSFHPKALWRTKKTLMALGFPEDFSGEIDPEMLLSKMAKITVAVETGRGADPETGEAYPDRNTIKKTQPIGTKASDLL